MILNCLAEYQRECVAIAVSRCRRPLPLLTLVKQPYLNILACNCIHRQLIEMLPDDLELDNELMVMLRRMALFRIEFGPFGKDSKGDAASS